jgi:serine protease
VGRTIAGYSWAITSGASQASFVGATDGSTANLATSAAGTVVVQLTVTDNTGASLSSSQTITVSAAPVVVTPTNTGSGAGGGGGAMGAGWLAGLAVAVVLLLGAPGRRRPLV